MEETMDDHVEYLLRTILELMDRCQTLDEAKAMVRKILDEPTAIK